MDVSNIIMIVVIVAGVAMMILERIKPDRELPWVEGWWTRAIALNAGQLAMVFVAAWTWDTVLQSWSLLALRDHMPSWAGGILAYLVSTFAYYWWHRARHQVQFLWQGFHQVHHSPSRLEVITSFYKHPLEIGANSILTSLIVYTFLGLDFEAAAWNTLLSALAEFFYHLNMRTPRWLGFIIQRPEMHRIHHARGAHKYNYGDLPIWDMLFGTFYNPETFEEPCGFEDNKETNLVAMLAFQDVHKTGTTPWRTKLRNVGLGALLILGTLHISGDILGLFAPKAGQAVSGVAALTLASPRPKVFTRVGDHEPYGYAFDIEAENRQGEVQRFRLDPERYHRLEGPYMLRNIYGAMLAFGPHLPTDTVQSVLRHGLCDTQQLGAIVENPEDVRRVTITTIPRGLGENLSPVEVVCDAN